LEDRNLGLELLVE